MCCPQGNRRLDEWVTIDRFESLEKITNVKSHCADPISNGVELTDGGDRKITRNQKRKHDAINHIQKVFRSQIF